MTYILGVGCTAGSWHTATGHPLVLNTISELPHEALSTVQQWCDRAQLSNNQQKMVTVPFNQRRNLRGLKELTLSGHTLQLTTEVKWFHPFTDHEGP